MDKNIIFEYETIGNYPNVGKRVIKIIEENGNYYLYNKFQEFGGFDDEDEDIDDILEPELPLIKKECALEIIDIIDSNVILKSCPKNIGDNSILDGGFERIVIRGKRVKKVFEGSNITTMAYIEDISEQNKVQWIQGEDIDSLILFLYRVKIKRLLNDIIKKLDIFKK